MEKTGRLNTDIEKSNFLIVKIDEEKSEDKIQIVSGIIKHITNKICYVCLSIPYKDIYNELKKSSIDITKFHFIDTLSSHYEIKNSNDNCTFLSGPDILEINRALNDILDKKTGSTIIFDTISSMLIYQKTSDILHFTYNILKNRENKIIYFAFKKDSVPLDENEMLFKDLNMFADKMIYS